MAADVPHETIDALQWEQRRFPPPEGFKADALATGTDLYEDAAEDDEGFWARQAEELVSWSAPWHTICHWELPNSSWFLGGTLNVYSHVTAKLQVEAADAVAALIERRGK